MNYETIVGPLFRVICCLIPFAWLPFLVIYYIAKRGWRERENKSQ